MATFGGRFVESKDCCNYCRNDKNNNNATSLGYSKRVASTVAIMITQPLLRLSISIPHFGAKVEEPHIQPTFWTPYFYQIVEVELNVGWEAVLHVWEKLNKIFCPMKDGFFELRGWEGLIWAAKLCWLFIKMSFRVRIFINL